MDFGLGMRYDKQGSVIMAGSFRDTVYFIPSNGVKYVKTIDKEDIFIKKIDNLGNILWIKQIKGVYGNRGQSLELDNYGNIYITGMFSDTVDFDPGPGVNIAVGKGWSDIFILKLDNNGIFKWVKLIQGSNQEFPLDLAIDKQNNLFIVGGFYETVDFDPGVQEVNGISKGNVDYFILKLDNNGIFKWVKTYGSLGTDHATSIATDSKDNVIVTGYYGGTIDFNPGSNSSEVKILTDGYGYDVFIQKFDNLGNFLWVKQIGGIDYEISNSIATDNYDNIYSTGFFKNVVDFNSDTGQYLVKSVGSEDVYVLKLNGSGGFMWVRQLGGLYQDQGSHIAFSSKCVYVTGKFQDKVKYVYSFDSAHLQSNGSYDYFILKLSDDGNFNWLTSNGGKGDDEGVLLDVGEEGSFYYTGSFDSTFVFSNSTKSDTFKPKGDKDIMLIRYACDKFLSINRTGNKLTSSVNAQSYQWLDCNNLYKAIPNAKDSIFNVTAAGNYALVVHSFGGCIDTSNCISITMSQIEEVNDLNIQIIPNPNDGKFKIEIDAKTLKKICIYNLIGKKIVEINSTKDSSVFDLKLTNGTYFIEIESVEGISRSRLKIEN